MHKAAPSLGLILYQLRYSKLFIFGLLLKIFMILIFSPEIQASLFLPFMQNIIIHPSFDPWDSFFLAGGDPKSFPYGPVMALVHVFPMYVGSILDGILDLSYFSALGFRISLLCCDFAILISLIRQYHNGWHRLIMYFWLSPMSIFITYWHGQTDVVPVMFLTFAFASVSAGRPGPAGFFLGLGVAAKHTVLIAIPFFLLFLWFRRGISSGLHAFLVCFAATLLILEGAYLFSDGFVTMVLQNREVQNLFWLSIAMGPDVSIYLIPVAYIGLCYYTWHLRRMNAELLGATVVVAFGILIVLSPAPPGWYFWMLPMFSALLLRSGMGSLYLYVFCSLTFVAYHSLATEGSSINFGSYNPAAGLANSIFEDYRFLSLLNTLTLGLLGVLLFQIFRDRVMGNDFFVMSRRPILIGIAGDSGTGKSTLVEAVRKLFGEPHSVAIHGDDYHKWDRFSPMWKTTTHLNPRANDHFRMLRDVRSLLNDGSAETSHYDHGTGLFKQFERRQKKELILVEGLHALYLPSLTNLYDVRIFLSMDEELRRGLKISRDVESRGKDLKKTLLEIERRISDRDQYVAPQVSSSDIWFHLRHEESVQGGIKIGSGKSVLRVKLVDAAFCLELVRLLTGLCGLRADMEAPDREGATYIEIQGDVSADDIALAVSLAIPHFQELVNFESGFMDGISGVMQLILLMQMNEVVKHKMSFENA